MSIPPIGNVEPLFPYVDDHSQLMQFKIVMINSESTPVYTDVDGLLDYFAELDNLTRGVPKLAVLVGYQAGGHDHGFPFFASVDSRIHSSSHPQMSPVEAMNYLMKTARENYNTKCTLHINFIEGYNDSHLYNEYLAKGLFALNWDGTLRAGWYDSGRQAYLLDFKAGWDSGETVKRVDELFELLPELKYAGTVYTDANWAFAPNDFTGVSQAEQFVAMRKVISYFRNRYNTDIIGEFAYQFDYGYVTTGISWGLSGGDDIDPMKLPAYFMSGGTAVQHSSGSRNPTPGYMDIFGSSVQLEHDFYHSDTYFAGREFALDTLPYFFLNSKLRENYDSVSKYAEFSDNVRSFRYSGDIADQAAYSPLEASDGILIKSMCNEFALDWYVYDNGNGLIRLGNNPTDNSYVWLREDTVNGTTFRNKKTGNYICIENFQISGNVPLYDDVGPIQALADGLITNGSQYWDVASTRDGAFSIQNTWAAHPVYMLPNTQASSIGDFQPVHTLEFNLWWGSPHWFFETAPVFPNDEVTIKSMCYDYNIDWYVCDNGSGLIRAGNAPVDDSYVWIRIETVNGTTFKNKQTGNYICIEDFQIDSTDPLFGAMGSIQALAKGNISNDSKY